MNTMNSHLLLLILTVFACIDVGYPRVLQDMEKQLQAGTSRVFLGVVVGNVATIKQGIEEGGNVVSTFDPFIAETILKLGEPYVDYPICPPLHLAFNYGQKDHANVAAYLLRLGADVNAYQLPTHPKNHFERGYPPAILYSLGLGQYPSNTHAAFLQRIYRSYSDRFNLTAIEDWRIQTDNPPLLHMSVALRAFDSVYVLLSEFPRIATIHTADRFNMTALHYAAYLEDLRSLVMLLYNQANTTAQDMYGHSPLHLAVMRGEGGAASLLLSTAHQNNRTTLAQKQRQFSNMLHVMNKDHVDVLDMICLSALPLPLLHTVFYHASLVSLSPHTLPRARNHFQQACIERAIVAVSAPRGLEDMAHEDMRGGGGLGGVDVLSAPFSAALAEYFYTHHFILHRPARFEEGLYMGSPIWAYLDSMDSFSRHFRKLRVFSTSTATAANAASNSSPNPNADREYGGGRRLGTWGNKKLMRSMDDFMKLHGEHFFLSEDRVGVQLELTNSPNSSLHLYHYLSSALHSSGMDSGVASDIDDGSTVDVCIDGIAKPECANPHGDRASDQMQEFHAPLSNGEAKGEYDHDFPRPSLFNLCGDNDDGAQEMTFSIANSTSFRHFRSATSHLLLRGRMVWGLVPPSLLTNTSLLAQLQDRLNVSVAHLNDVPSRQYNAVFSFLYMHHLVVLVEQREAEAMYLPPHYAAYTTSLSSSMLVSMELCAHDVREQRVQPLGYAIYGGKDEYRGYGFKRTHFVSNMEVDASLRPKKKPPVFQNPHIH